MTTNRRSEPADGLIAGLNRDSDQRAATQLLCTAAGGIWLSKLDGWPEYLRDLEDDRHQDALWADWHQLWEDLAGLARLDLRNKRPVRADFDQPTDG